LKKTREDDKKIKQKVEDFAKDSDLKK